MMDIAALLAPGSAPPVVDPAVAAVSVPAAPGEAFSDLFAAAMVDSAGIAGGVGIAPLEIGMPASSGPPNVGASVNFRTVVVDPNAISIGEMTAPDGTPAVPLVPSVAPTVTPASEAIAPEIPNSQGDIAPAVELPNVESPPGTPPPPPLTALEISRKDATTEVPNAPERRPDQPEEEEAKRDVNGDPLLGLPAPTVPVAVTPQPVLANPPLPNQSSTSDASVKAASQNAESAVTGVGMKKTDDRDNATPVKSTGGKKSTGEKRGKSATGLSEARTPSETSAPELATSPTAAMTQVNGTAPDLTSNGEMATDESNLGIAAAAGKAENAKNLGGTDAPAISETVLKPQFEAAPDLGIVPQVATAPVTSTENTVAESSANLTSKAEGLKIESQGALDAPATILAPKLIEKPSTETKVVTSEAVPVIETTTKSGPDDSAGNPGDSPKDNAPQLASPVMRTAATEKPEAGSDRPVVDRQLVVRQVADRIENLVASRPRDGVTVHLEPRDLGTITLVIKGLSSSLDVQMVASDSRVRESLETSRAELAQSLAPRGIELRDIRVTAASSSDGAGTGTAPRDQGGSNPDGRPRHPSQSQTSTQSFPTSAGRPATSSRSRHGRNGRGVDLLA